MTRSITALYRFLAVSFVIVNEINAQFQCSGRWAYICEGRRRALKEETAVRELDVPIKSVDDGDRIAASAASEKNQSDEEEFPEWFSNLVAKSWQPIAEDNVQWSESIDSQPSLSLPVAAPHQLATFEHATDVTEDDEESGRRRRLEDLARRLISADGTRRDDAGREIKDRKYDGGPDGMNRIHRKRTSSSYDTATRKRLLSKWLEENRN